MWLIGWDYLPFGRLSGIGGCDDVVIDVFCFPPCISGEWFNFQELCRHTFSAAAGGRKCRNKQPVALTYSSGYLEKEGVR